MKPLKTLVFTKVKKPKRTKRFCEVLSRVQFLSDLFFNSFSLTALLGGDYGGRERGKGREVSKEIILEQFREKMTVAFIRVIAVRW